MTFFAQQAWWKNRAGTALVAVASVLAVGVYLLAAQQTYRLGFPLDDAWIHQTYARSLAQTGQWYYNAGQVSAGSTSPLWSVLLSIGHLSGLAPLGWGYLLGWAALFWLAWLGEKLYRELNPGSTWGWPLVGPFLVGEWHLVWAAGSGMETLLEAATILCFFRLISRKSFPPFLAGLLSGASAWLRPDGLTLAGPLFFVLVLSGWSDKKRLAKQLGLAALGLVLGALPFFGFNFTQGGSWWPNTYFAKQAEYAVRQQEPFGGRFLRLAALPMIGAGVALLPGALYLVWAGFKRRNWTVLSVAIWWAGYTGIYAANLPVDYQHGRYLMPAMPVFFVLGLAGTLDLFRMFSGRKSLRLLRTGWAALIGLLWTLFFAQGALAYGTDVAIIETEMVNTARWVAANTPSQAVIGAHDIGALGYFGGRRLVDLAGLISPEVIPYIRDEVRLADKLDQAGAGYLVTFPDWYPQLVQRGKELYRSTATFSITAGGENMVIYEWRLP